ncbi:MAG: aa3-type cytochrome oxidase subunit II [Acidimicrobiales bacterium]
MRPVPHRREVGRLRWSAGALLAGAAVGLGGCALPRFGAPDPASSQGRNVAHLWSGFFVVAMVVTLFVWVPLAFSLVRYRRRRGDDEIPSQRAYHIPLEILYTAVPIVIVAVLFFFSVRTEHKVTAVSAHPAARVEVVGFQWGWRFRYVDEGFTVDADAGEMPTLVLPVGRPSNLRLVSKDVNHSFWVPRFLSKRDLIPGVRNEITVTPDRAGSYVGRCAEFCGLDHWRMSFSVKVVPMAQYQSWVAGRKAAGS